MKHLIFGQKAGLRVSTLALGTGNFGNKWGVGATKEDARLIFDKYVEAGGTFIDTADGYQFGQSEEFLGEFMAGRREQLVLASKYTTGGDHLHTTGNSRKSMIRAVEHSLKRLQTDRLDLYWVHMADGQTPIEEIVRGLDDMVRAGKINYAGFSNFPAWRIASAALLADLRGWAPIIGIQIEYNLIERTAERELLPMAEALGLGVAFWSPLAGGTLTGKYRSKETDPNSRKEKLKGFLVKEEKGARGPASLDTLEEMAKETGWRLMDIALAWVRQRYRHTALSTVTIIGPKSVQQLEDNLQSLDIRLSEEQLLRLDVISDIELGSPHEIIKASQPAFFGRSTGEIDIKHPVA